MYSAYTGHHDLPPDVQARLERAAEIMARHIGGEEENTYDQPLPFYRAEDDASGTTSQLTRTTYRPFEEIAKALIFDPELIRHFHGHNHRPDMDVDFGPEPSDPDHRTRWKILQEVAPVLKARFARSYDREQRQNRRTARERKLALLAEHDPLFKRTMALIAHYPNLLMPACRARLAHQLEHNPNAFMELYGDLRNAAEEVEHHYHALKQRKCKQTHSGSTSR